MLYTRAVLLVAGAMTPHHHHHISPAAPLITQEAHPIHQGPVILHTILTVELEEDFGQVTCVSTMYKSICGSVTDQLLNGFHTCYQPSSVYQSISQSIWPTDSGSLPFDE